MSKTPLKFLEGLPTPFTPVNAAVVAGEKLEDAAAKFQGQINALSSGAQPSVSKDGTQVASAASDLNFTGDVAVYDDGDGTATINVAQSSTESVNMAGFSETETLTERRWIDGKPIYRKVVDLGDLSANANDTNTEQAATLGVPDYDSVTYALVILNWHYDGGSYYESNTNQVRYHVRPVTGNVELRYKVSTASSALLNQVYVVLEYTKAADTASSPVASFHLSTTDNVKVAGYSTEEVLTERRWIDGRPIYRKVVETTGIVTDGTSKNVTLVNAGETIVDSSLIVWEGSAQFLAGAGYADRQDIGSGEFDVLFKVEDGKLFYILGTSRSAIDKITTTVEYVKSTDTAHSPVKSVALSHTGKLVTPGYSTSEVLTERRWVDGKPIYRKVRYLASALVQDDTTRTVNYTDGTLDVDTLVHTEIKGNRAAMWSADGSPDAASANWHQRYRCLDNQLQYRVGSSHTAPEVDGTTPFIYEYTKTADTADSSVAAISLSHTGSLKAPGYDTTEVLTERRWVNGKPIYRKVCYLSAAPVYDGLVRTVNIAGYPSGVDGIVQFSVNGNRRGHWSFYTGDNVNLRNIYYLSDSTTGVITYYLDSNRMADLNENMPIVLEYTKTADTSDSPTAKLSLSHADNVLMSSFSTAEELTEQRWIDGKPLYRKVLHVTSPSDGQSDIPFNISGYEHISIVEAAVTRSDGRIFTDAIYFSATSEVNWHLALDVGDVVRLNHNFTGKTPTNAYFVFEYTKSADTSSSPVAQLGVGTGTPRTYTGQQQVANSTLTDGATIDWNLDTAQNADVTLGGNRTINNPTNMVNGGKYTLRVVQDATGSRTVTWGSAFKWAGGTAPTLSTGANAVDIIEFTSDGTNMYGVPHQNFS